jgi:SAM-dependent methyltransferase
MRRVKAILKRVLPARVSRVLQARLGRSRPPVGAVRFGSLRRLTPIDRAFGFDRGLPIDRYYIESFLARCSGAQQYGVGDIRGHVLEIGDDWYTRKFGTLANPEGEGGGEATPGSVEKVDVLHVGAQNPKATIVADLVSADHVPSDSFDCIICTQTLSVIYDVRAAIATLHRLLKPGGVVLATFPGITKSITPDKYIWGDYWRFTAHSAKRLFEEVFPAGSLTVDSYGNVLAAVAFLHGLATEELTQDELDLHDPDYEVLITVRAAKPEA